MDVKSDKTFEEIVERLAALFKMKPRPGERDYEVLFDHGDSTQSTPDPSEPSVPPFKKQK